MITSGIKHITAFVLILILFAQNINTLVIVGDFLINQDFIAKTLCIQKEEQNGCNGKCQLRKQLAENDNSSDNKAPLQTNERMSLDVFCLSSINTVKPPFVLHVQLPSVEDSTSGVLISRYLEIDTPPPIFS